MSHKKRKNDGKKNRIFNDDVLFLLAKKMERGLKKRFRESLSLFGST
jgi:hypothetical protein